MQNSGQRNSQGRDVGQRIEVCRAVSVAHPQPFLTCGFEAGIVTLTLSPQGVCPLETEAAAVNGKSVIVWNGLVFRAAPVFLAVIPVFVVTRANTGLGLTEGAAEFLPGTMIVGGFAVLVHSQSGLADRIAGRKRFRGFRTAWIEGDKCLALIDRFHGVVDVFHVIALVGKEGAFFQRNRLIRGREDLSGDGRIGDVARRGQLVERQAGDAVHQHMAFVSPVELIPPLIVLVGGRVDAEGAIRVAFRVVFLGELVLCKGFWIVLLGVCHDGCGVQTNERGVHDSQFVQLPYQISHDRLQRTIVQLPQAAVIGPVGRQRLHDVKAAVMGDDAVIVQIIHQICDLRETLAFHNDKSTDHGFFREAPPPGCRPRQREVQTAEKLVVKRSGALGCEQRHILNDFLSVDSGQPLSGWFSLKSILPKRGSAFYII